MFRSLFSKYISAFLLINVLSFAAIISIITSIINGYSQNVQRESMKMITASSREYVSSQLESSDTDDLSELVSKNNGSIDRIFSAVTQNAENITMLISDTSGNVFGAFGTNSESFSGETVIPADFVEFFKENNGEFLSADIAEDSPHLFYSMPIENESGEQIGYIFVGAPERMLSRLLSVIVRSVILGIIWIMLATLIAVYVISERIIAPLKEISRAARKFASGQLDVRVRVHGCQEVAELGAAFNNMAQSLEASEKMRNTFISNVSHDLRTPMTSISGFVDGILDGVIPPEKHKHYLKIVSEEIKRLSRLVVSLLDISRIQAGERKFTMTPFDVCEMSRQILFSFEKKIDSKNLNIEFDFDEENITAIADRDAIYQVLYNICDNAVKFSKERGTLRISVKKQKNRRYLVSIYNEGVGLSPEDLTHIFERFYKSDKSRGLDKSGVGLGLYICKTIIEAHGEEIWATSDAGKSCTFSFTVKGQ
ncbi:MAG: sensor histidine kinase [Clostridia bacterium]|nr:sensor histidine kinase [Clostridia bacterium]